MLRNQVLDLIVFIALVSILLSVMCANILGLFLSFVGSLLLLTPAFPRYSRILFETLPFRSFSHIIMLEDKIKDIPSEQEIEFREGEPSYNHLQAILKRYQDGVADRIILKRNEEASPRSVAATINVGEGYSENTINASKSELRNLLERASERQMLAVGATVLATGFALQLLSQVGIPIVSPVRLIC